MSRHRVLRVLSCLLVGTAWGAHAPTARADAASRGPGSASALSRAEGVIAAEEAASERAFDPVFRERAKRMLASLSPEELETRTREGGLGLSALGDSQADLVYTPLTPCRIIDTRLAGGALAPGTPRSFRVTGSDYSGQGGSATGCGVPFGPTTAAVINFVAASATGFGNLRITPFGRAIPLASIINFHSATNVANGVAVAICDPGSATCTSDLTVVAQVSATQLVADVQGYFRRVTSGGVGTALLADSAVTAPKIASGAVVRSLNGQTDAVTLAGTNGLSLSQGSGTVTVTSNATSASAAGTIVSRDGTASFSAGSIGLAGNLGLPNTTSASAGMLTMGGDRLLHGFPGGSNLFLGVRAGNLSLTGVGNTAVGGYALHFNTTGHDNAAFGGNSLHLNTSGVRNTAVGSALYANTTGFLNAAFGYWALDYNATGNYNAAFGAYALQYHPAGNGNTAFGVYALNQLSSGGPTSRSGTRPGSPSRPAATTSSSPTRGPAANRTPSTSARAPPTPPPTSPASTGRWSRAAMPSTSAPTESSARMSPRAATKRASWTWAVRATCSWS